MNNQEEIFSFIAKNESLWCFCWTVFIERIRTGGIEENYYDLKMGNSFFDVNFKLTIKRIPTYEEKQELKELGIDIDELIKTLDGELE